MTFFDTLKDKNVKAIFRVLAWDRHKGRGSMEQIMQNMTFEERLEIFALTHAIMKAVGIPGWQKPAYLNASELRTTGAAILSRKTRPDND